MRIALIFIVVLISLACQPSNDFKEIRDFKNSEWFLAHKQTFSFEVKDVTKEYQFNYLVRNSISYPFYNLFLQQKLTDSSGNVLSTSIDEIHLFEPKTGKPYGDGTGDVFDSRIPAPKLASYKFEKPGTYKWIINHNMRPDPLTGIISLGIEVLEKK